MQMATNEWCFFSAIAWYYCDSDFVTFRCIAHVTRNTDTDSCVTCSEKYRSYISYV